MNQLAQQGMRIDVRVNDPRNPERHARVNALIDTGADLTSFEANVLENVGYQPIGYVPIRTVTGVNKRPVYDVYFHLEGHDRQFALRVVGMQKFNKDGPAFGLIGRDLLEMGELHYNGQDGTFALSFPVEASASLHTLAVHTLPIVFEQNEHGGLFVPSVGLTSERVLYPSVDAG